MQGEKMKRYATLAAALAAIALSAPAASKDIGYPLIGAANVVTLVNLHPDEAHKRLYSVNYLLEGLMPVCTRVKILSVTNKQMVFELADGGAKYEYVFHPAMKDPIPKHLDRYFGTSCPRKKIDSLTGVNKQGVLEGRLILGMTKDAVILAVGYPPEHATPSLEFSIWKYWRNRFATRLVHFENDKVEKLD
jgi:hypothetical protein